jgi:predicted dehydrogenase
MPAAAKHATIGRGTVEICRCRNSAAADRRRESSSRFIFKAPPVMSDIKFAAIGINHNHIYGQVDCLLQAGAEFTGFFAPEDDLAALFGARYPQARRVADARAILEDARVAVVLTAAIPADRAAIAIAAMQHGKDVLSDKPGMTSFAQLEDIKRVQQETGRIFSVLYSEHFEGRATVEAGKLIAAGAIGEVVNTVGLGPHSLRLNNRPEWFFTRPRYGGILTDIASHQFEQFLFFSDALDGEVVSASVHNRHHADRPGLQDVGDAHVRTARTTGYIRVDWMTPEGLPTWGDGRLTILGTEGYIELRKYIDIAGRPGDNHLFLVDRTGVRHIDCSGVELPFGRQFLADIRDRTETAMPHERCFNAMKLALTAQAMAERDTEWAQ